MQLSISYDNCVYDRRFQPGEGPNRGLLCDCENFAECLFTALISTKQALHLTGTQVKSVSNKQSDVFLSMCPAAGL